jgi:hypothetical protein
MDKENNFWQPKGQERIFPDAPFGNYPAKVKGYFNNFPGHSGKVVRVTGLYPIEPQIIKEAYTLGISKKGKATFDIETLQRATIAAYLKDPQIYHKQYPSTFGEGVVIGVLIGAGLMFGFFTTALSNGMNW